MFSTWGNQCEKCLPGYYGSALAIPRGDCEACSCSKLGTQPETDYQLYEEAKSQGYLRYFLSKEDFFSCNTDGNCRCKANVAGKKCDVCVDGYWGLTSGQGCSACNCDPLGSVNRLCDDRTGQCTCKPGITGKQCDQCKEKHWGFSAEGCTDCGCDKTGSNHTRCDLKTGQCPCRPNVEGKHCEMCKENMYNKEEGCLECEPCYSLVKDAANAHRMKIARLRELLDQIEQNPLSINDSNFDRQLNEIVETVRRLLQEAKDAQGTDNSLVAQLEEINERIKKVMETESKIRGELDGIAVGIEHGKKNIDIAKSIAESALTELKNARSYLENDGKKSLEKARARADKYGNQSKKMSEIAREARKLADDHENQAGRVIEIFVEAQNTSERAYQLAKDAINTKITNQVELDRLKNILNEVKDQYQMTDKLATAVHTDADKAQRESLGLLTDVNNIKVPELESARYKTEALNIIAQAKAAQKDSDAILAGHAELLNSTGLRLTDAEGLFNEAQRQQQITDKLLADVDAALNQTKAAIAQGDAILEEAKKTLKTLKEFDQTVQSSKKKALDAMKKIPSIENNIAEAEKKTLLSKETIQNALQEALNALDLAKEAEKRANQASKQAKEIRENAKQTKENVQRLNDLARELQKKVDKTDDLMQTREKQAQEDSNLVKSALEYANTAKTSANDAMKKLGNATKTIHSILEELSKFLFHCFDIKIF